MFVKQIIIYNILDYFKIYICQLKVPFHRARHIFIYCHRYEPIFMKLTWLVRAHPRVNSIIFGNNRPNSTTDMGENVPPKSVFSAFIQPVWVFLRKKLKNSISYPSHKKGYIFITVIWHLGPSNMVTPPKNFFSWLFWKIVFFFEKTVEWKIFKTSFPTKKVILIFVARRSLLKTVMSSHKWFFAVFSKNTAFLEKLV